MNLRTRRRMHWAVPAAVLAVTAGITSLARILPAGADPVPVLPALTPAQLLDKVHSASVTTLSGDIRLSSHLGLPDLSSLGVGGGTLLDLLSGDHTAHVWIDGPEHVRVAIDSPQAESDWIRNGKEVWWWDSSRQHVTHATIPDRIVDSATDAANAGALLDPTAAAEQLLASIDPTTAVTVQTPGYVAGRPVYELVVSPRSDKSTIGDGVISVDAATGIPLAVRIDARGTTTPALEVTLTSVSFDKPPASTFAFTPPPGATVDETDDPTRLLPLGGFGRDFRDEGDRVERAAAPDGEVKGTDAKGSAPATVTSVGPTVTDVGTGWERVVIISGLDVGHQFRVLFENSPTVTVGNQSARLVSTTLVNMLVLDDGRIALAAMTPDAMAAAIAGQ